MREMNARRMIIGLAHAPYSVTRDPTDASDRPMMISHTNLSRGDLQHPRLISVEHARLVRERGGIVGSVPSGIGQKTLADWIENILRLVDSVGIDQVAIGTDMDANFAPVFTDYKLWSLIPRRCWRGELAWRTSQKSWAGTFVDCSRRSTHRRSRILCGRRHAGLWPGGPLLRMFPSSTCLNESEEPDVAGEPYQKSSSADAIVVTVDTPSRSGFCYSNTVRSSNGNGRDRALAVTQAARPASASPSPRAARQAASA